MFARLSITHRDIFDKYLGAEKRSLSVYAFPSIYVWKDLFDIRWTERGGKLFVFFEDSNGLFLYLPPLGRAIEKKDVLWAFDMMEKKNGRGGANVTRIDNLDAHGAETLGKMGFCVKERPEDLVCERVKLAGLKGDGYKSKRALCNHFMKNNLFSYRAVSDKDNGACLKLYGEWADDKRARGTGSVYRGMMDDSLTALKAALKEREELGITGRAVEIGGALKAFTLGYELNKDVFCVFYEITAPGVKGLAQFIFREFCGELPHRYMNIMDDSGLENLRKVKLSYHPDHSVRSFTATQDPISRA